MLEFDIDSIRKNKIELLDCQVDLILKSLEMYKYMYGFMYPRKKLSEEENLRISLIVDTYHQILSEYVDSQKINPIKKYKKIA